MQSSDIPAKFPIPFANGAGASFVRNIPTASQIPITAGAASLNDGFPPLNATPRASGGVPPFIQDMNGVLRQSTGWDRWLAAGGPIIYDAAFSTAIGGYPRYATLIDSTGSFWWVSTIENNTNAPPHSSWRKVDLAEYMKLTDFNNQFSSGNNANGYWRRSPAGAGTVLTEQWGTVVYQQSEGPVLRTFPVPFTNLASVSVVITLTNTFSTPSDNDMWAQVRSVTLTQFTAYYQATSSGNLGSGFHWHARGY